MHSHPRKKCNKGSPLCIVTLSEAFLSCYLHLINCQQNSIWFCKTQKMQHGGQPWSLDSDLVCWFQQITFTRRGASSSGQLPNLKSALQRQSRGWTPTNNILETGTDCEAAQVTRNLPPPTTLEQGFWGLGLVWHKLGNVIYQILIITFTLASPKQISEQEEDLKENT